MTAKAGDRIQILGQNVGTAGREGEILEVVEGAVSVRYRIRWQDGHESVLSPTGGSAVIVPKASAKAGTKTSSKGAKGSAKPGGKQGRTKKPAR